LYHEPPILNNSVVFGVSQSGQSPDIVSVLEESHRQGALTIAITNNLSSPLSKSADFSIDILAGEEKAIAATKTYTAQLVIIAMISSALTRDRESRLEMNKLSEWINKIILQEKCIQEIAYNYKGIEKCVVLGRGYNYASAFEWALKLKELSFISSEAYSSADFQHGPIAVLDNDYPVFVIAPEGKVLPSLYETVKNIQLRLSPKVLTISNNSNMLSISSDRISIPYDIPEWLSPIPAIIAGQLFTYHLTCSKNLDPNNPRLLKKVTETE
jgi:glucosamine--fructose-6-phosphate aminotransferase (isomerizing)